MHAYNNTRRGSGTSTTMALPTTRQRSTPTPQNEPRRINSMSRLKSSASTNSLLSASHNKRHTSSSTPSAILESLSSQQDTSSASYGSPQEQDMTSITSASPPENNNNNIVHTASEQQPSNDASQTTKDGENKTEESYGAKVSLISNWLTSHVDMENSFVYNDRLWVYMSKDVLFEYDVSAHAKNTNDSSLTGWIKHVLKPSDKQGYPCCSEEFKLTVHGDFLYIYGGVNYKEKGFDRIWRLDLKTKKWRRVGLDDAEIYAVPHFDSSVFHGEHIICCGRSFKGNVYRFSIKDSTQWQDKVKNPTSPRSQHTALMYGEKMVVFGGLLPKTEEGANTLLYYDTAEMSWSETENKGGYTPRGRYGHSATLYLNKYMLIYGGLHTATTYADPSQIEVFDLENDCWIPGGIRIAKQESSFIARRIGQSVVPSMTNNVRMVSACDSRMNHRTLAVGGRLCVLGGEKKGKKLLILPSYKLMTNN